MEYSCIQLRVQYSFIWSANLPSILQNRNNRPYSCLARPKIRLSNCRQRLEMVSENGCAMDENDECLEMVSENGCAMDENDELWHQLRYETKLDADAEPALASYLYATILVHRTMEQALAYHLGNKLSNPILSNTLLYNLVVDVLKENPEIRDAIRIDMRAVREKDPACDSYCHCLLNFKGFLACQAHRVAHRLWSQGRIPVALAIQSRVSEAFAMDIHPAAKIGKGVLFDHGTGVVIGETASIGDNVSILHHVTLGGTGKQGGDRHPKIGNGVLIGAGATILGNIKIGEGAKIGAGAVVLIEVPPRTTAVGNPARLVGGKRNPTKLTENPSETMDHTSFIRHLGTN